MQLIIRVQYIITIVLVLFGCFQFNGTNYLLSSQDFRLRINSVINTLRNIPSVLEHLNDGIEPLDGCGLGDQKPPYWIHYTKEDYNYGKKLWKCKESFMQRINTGDWEPEDLRNNVNVTKLMCQTTVDLDILFEYSTIHMIGDSLMREQFLVIICMMDLNSTFGIDTEEKVEYTALIRRPGTENFTKVVYTQFGHSFRALKPLYEHQYPLALRKGTSNDLIVINAGHHYNSEMASTLIADVKFIVKKARGKITQVFFMETSGEEYPTSNGFFPHKDSKVCCCNKCTCQPLNEATIQGNGYLDVKAYNFSSSFGLLIHDRETLDPIFDPDLKINHSNCVPSCYPSNWRNQLVRNLFQNSTNVHIVPIWRQLAYRPHLNSIRWQECTHHAVDTALEVNRQLLRKIMTVRLRARRNYD
jgi:hypothetical protein